MATIPFDEIVPGATVRFTLIDLIMFLSVRDIIMHISGKSRKRASETWSNLQPKLKIKTQKDANRKWERLSEDQKKELEEDIQYFKFPGQGQTMTPVITIEGAMKLIMMLPGKQAKAMRVQAADILTRYVMGNDSLITEIQHNKKIGPMAACHKLAKKAALKLDQYTEMPLVSYIYATKSEAFPGLIKIGRSSNVDARISSLNTGCAPYPHAIIAVAPTYDAPRDELSAHTFFSAQRREGEFFETTEGEVRDFFANHIMTLYQKELCDYIAKVQGTV